VFKLSTRRIGRVEVYLHAFFDLGTKSWSASRLDRYIPTERAPGTHWIGSQCLVKHTDKFTVTTQVTRYETLSDGQPLSFGSDTQTARGQVVQGFGIYLFLTYMWPATRDCADVLLVL